MKGKNQWLAALGAIASLAGPGAALGEEAAPLEWRFARGEVLGYRVVQEQVQATTGFRDVHARQTLTIAVREEVTEVDASGTATLVVTYPAVRVEAEDPRRGRYAYDSTSAADLARPDAPPQSALLETTVTCKMDRAGRVSDASVRQAGRAAAVPELARAFGAEPMQRQLETWFHVVPGRVVKRSDSWTGASASEVPSLGSLRIESVFTLEAFEARGATPCARIARASTITATAATKPDTPAQTRISLRSGGSKGRYFFDAARGRLEAGATELTLDLDIELAPPAPGDPPPVLHQHVEQKATLELVEARTPP